MFKNYLTVALRNLTKNKIYVLINTLGMGIAMACCMTAYLLIAYNLEFDDYYDDADVKDIVKVMHHVEQFDGKQDQELTTPIVMAPWAAREISGIEDFTRFCNDGGIVHYGDNAFHENIRFADASFLDMFNVRLKSGTPKNFETQSIFLSEPLAKKYFANDDPVGKTMSVTLQNKKYEVTVGGVLEKIPLNTSFQIQALMRIETYLDAYEVQPDNWRSNHSAAVLLKLSDITQRTTISEQMNKYVRLRNEGREESLSTAFELLPFKKTIPKSEVTQADLRLPIPFIALLIFSTLGTIILLIACFNLTNTTIALTAKRLKEIGIRKVVGSSRKQIISQFLLEMIILLIISLVAGVLLAQIIVPEFALMWQIQYGLEDLNGVNNIIALILLLFISAILAGIYPALFGSRFRPALLLKGGANIKGTGTLTRTLLVFQFSLSVMVLIAGVVFIQNAEYQEKLSFGYDKENILVVTIQDSLEYDRFKNVIHENPDIAYIAGARNHVGPYRKYYRTIILDTASLKTNVYVVGLNYFNAIGLDVIKGRDFMEGSKTDYESAVIVDENFMHNHRLREPFDTRILFEDKPHYIIGIVKNHLNGLEEEDNNEHVYFLAKPAEYQAMIIRANSINISKIRDDLQIAWKKTFPDRPFQCEFQEEIIYKEADGYNGNLKQIFLFLTVLGCLLSASGIYALASLNARKRTKEIGVRKVLGASVTSIIQLLNKEFAIILILAAILGGAGGSFLTNALLKDLYAQHIDISIIVITLCGLGVFIIGISTTIGTAFRAAVTNPAETLKSE